MRERSSGVLLPLFSLPSQQGVGCLGKYAFEFVNHAVEWGFRYWQICPLGPTGYGDSPYQPFSAFGGNPYFIDLEKLTELGLLRWDEWLNLRQQSECFVDYGLLFQHFEAILQKACKRFFECKEWYERFEVFLHKNKEWLEPYSWFRALKRHFGGNSWMVWPKEFQSLKAAINNAGREIQETVNFYAFTQFLFFEQWKELKEHAKNKGLLVLGDIPLYVGMDSADVWATREIFQWNYRDGCPQAVSGVPPDYFSVDGQLWGTPLFDWEFLKQNNYRWWVERVKKNLEWFDLVRLDHFRGFYDYWAVPFRAKTAKFGEWREGPKDRLFEVLKKAFPEFPFIAEDLGDLHAGVIEFKKRLDLPGMAVLQFAFDGPENIYLPHNLDSNTVLYTGTHDNDTSLGWYYKALPKVQDYCRRYLRINGENVSWDFIRTAYASVSDLAIIPFQDILSLGSEARINAPGTSQGNWKWRCTVSDWHRIERESANYLNELAYIYDRKSKK